MKEEIKAGREALQRLWQGGLSGKPLLLRHTEIIDTNLADYFAGLGDLGADLALVALGGYGRRELFPFSDIDLLLLHQPSLKPERLKQAAEAILYPLWDSGLEVGHRVRTVAGCLSDCHQDFHLQMALLDARLLAGSRELLEELLSKYRKKYVDGHRQDFLEKITASREERQHRFGRHSFQLEPNIKEGRGGFRDYQSLRWTARVIFGLADPAAMAEAGLLSGDEHRRLEESHEQLIKVRNRLHYICGRKNDQLFYEHQEEIATALGYRNAPGRLGVESFMQEMYGSLQTIAVISAIFFEHTREIVDRSQARSTPKKIDGDLEIRHQRLSLIDPEQLRRHPALLLKIFAEAATRGLPIHYRTRQAITANLELVDDKFRHSRQLGRDFRRIFSSPTQPLEWLTAMLETGFLTAYLPEFSAIRALAQHDLYHIFTVDRHLLQAVAEIAKLGQELPEIFATLESPEVLYLATLLHDIGKGRDQDHARAGSELARQTAARLGLDDSELSDLEFLVRHHLFLSHMAQRRDLEDQGLIEHCLETITNRNRLDMLYLLSIADARATGPAAWNDWKMALFQELYLKIRNGLEHASAADRDLTQASQWMREQVGKLLGPSVPAAVSALTDDYLTNFTPPEIVEHLRLSQELGDRQILTLPQNLGDHWSILFISRDRTGLLARICGVLALHNLNVLAAKIHTWQDGTVVDLIEVRPAYDTEFTAQNWPQLEHDLDRALANRLGLAHRLADKNRPGFSPKVGRQHRHHQTQVRFDNRSSAGYTIIEIFADDQPALLYNITKGMADFEISIARALISTRREQLVDVFYVQNSSGDKITDPGDLEELRQALTFAAGH
ncbi:MAG: [protein-PII] uridylyltransferase [Desulfobulbaceae bacterium]|nr:[protein-PII] uridylyltransferase [Desulfobulbaceae bacterium]